MDHTLGRHHKPNDLRIWIHGLCSVVHDEEGGKEGQIPTVKLIISISTMCTSITGREIH
jgi:hypothetical protein